MVMEIVAKQSGNSLALMTVLFATIFGLGGALVSAKCYKAQERVRLVEPEQQQTSILECFKLLFQNKMLMLVTLSNLFGAFAFGNNLMTYFFKYKVPEISIAGFVLGPLTLTTVFGALTTAPSFLGMLLADKLKIKFKGYRNLLIFIQICTLVARVIAFFLGFEGKNIIAEKINEKSLSQNRYSDMYSKLLDLASIIEKDHPELKGLYDGYAAKYIPQDIQLKKNALFKEKNFSANQTAKRLEKARQNAANFASPR
jgi:hypothetical protein